MNDVDQLPIAVSNQRTDLAAQMVQVLPSFGEWTSSIRDFETPYGKLGRRQTAILYGLRHGQISDGPVSPTMLADYSGVQPSVITRVLARLEHSGFITRRTDPIDRRSQSVQITELGETISIYIENLFVHEMLDSMAFVDESQFACLRECLPVLLRIAIDLDGKRRRNRPSLLPHITYE